MLILTRREGETVIIRAGDIKIAVNVVLIEGNKVRIGFDAPPEVTVNRMEVQSQIDAGRGRKAPTFYTPGEK